MAIFTSLEAGAISGSTGGTTYSHNRGGPYKRRRAIPTNPSTAYQVAVRNGMVVLSPRWGDTLTQAQRDAWDVYALNVLLPNRLGNPINIGGIGHYVRSNVPRIQSGVADLPIVDAAPIIFNTGTFTLPTITAVSAATQLCTMGIENTDAWANEDDAAMLVFCSRPVSPARNFFKGPYRHALSILGDSVTPPTASQAFTCPFTVAQGQKVFIQTRVTTADGRLSSTFRGGDIVAA